MMIDDDDGKQPFGRPKKKWIELAQDCVQWWALVSVVPNL
jgi:hypothetical protein